MTPPPESEPPGWVVWSTRASIDAGTPSLTAIVETIIAVPLYWWLAIHFETYLPLLVSACGAPLVLLRSEASVALGVRLFTAWEEKSFERSGISARERGFVLWAAVIALATGAGLLSYMTAKTFISGQEAWPSVWRGVALGYVVAAAVGVTAEIATATVAGAGWAVTTAAAAAAAALIGAQYGAFKALGPAAAAEAGVLVLEGAALLIGSFACIFGFLFSFRCVPSDKLDSVSEPYTGGDFRQRAGRSSRRRRPSCNCTKKSIDLT